MQKVSSAAYSDTKPHYELLDGLRGVAALLVIWYHVFEGFATSPYDQKFNHGYLAVDFFFILSGFVIGYAYDDRWGKTLTIKQFFKRRLIRLHPMVILGAVFGAISYWLQGSERWDGVAVPLSMVLLACISISYVIRMPYCRMVCMNRAAWCRIAYIRSGITATARPAARSSWLRAEPIP